MRCSLRSIFDRLLAVSASIVVAAAVLLRLRSIRVPPLKREPTETRPTESKPTESGVVDRIALSAGLLAVAAGLGWWGLCIFNNSTDQPLNKLSNFSIYFGQYEPVENIDLFSRPLTDGKTDPPLYVMNLHYSEFPLEDNSGTRIKVAIGLNRDVVKPITLQLLIELTEPHASLADISDCVTYSLAPIPPPGSTSGSWNPEALPLQCKAIALPGISDSTIASFRRQVLPGEVALNITFEATLPGLSSLGVEQNETRVEVVLPLVTIPLGEFGSQDPGESATRINVQYPIANANEIAWSGYPGSPIVDYPAWDYSTLDVSSAGELRASGINEHAISVVRRNTFISGALLGLAGGAAISFMENVIKLVIFALKTVVGKRGRALRLRSH